MKPEPTSALSTFIFTIDSLAELESKILERVGYPLKPSDILSIDIDGQLLDLQVTITVWYWKEEKVQRQES